MSVFSKPPKDGRDGDGPPKPDPQSGKIPAAAPNRPPAPRAPGPFPPVTVSRSIDAGGQARTQARPAMREVHIGPPPAQPPPQPPKQPPAAAIPPDPATSRSKPLRPEARPPAPTQPDLSQAAQPAQPAQPARPEAPDISVQEQTVSIADTFERLLSSEDLDDGFAYIVRSSTIPGAPDAADALPTDLAEVRVLFAQLAANHVRQVRDFLIDLRWGEATAEWIGICQPALKSLRRAAEKLELAELCSALDRFAEALASAQTGGGRMIEGDRRAAILAAYEQLATLMPQAFALDLDRNQREAVILQSLLLQIPEVKKVTLDKLYAAGLTTLEAMLLANAGDVAATTGLSEALAARIVERFRAYREQIKRLVPDATRAQERDTIAELTARLRREHYEYELAAQSWTREAADRKRELRRARARTLLDIQVVLARLGEVRRLEDIDRLPFERKVAYLESFLEEARDKYVAP